MSGPEIELKGFAVNSRRVELQGFSGEVVDDKQWATTAFHGESSSSDGTVYHQLIVRGTDGEERVLRAANADIAVRPGHRVVIIYGRRGSTGRWVPVGLHNHTTRETAPIPEHVLRLVGVASTMGLLGSMFFFPFNLAWVLYKRFVDTPRQFAEGVRAGAEALPRLPPATS
jgi:hypothetical protein